MESMFINGQDIRSMPELVQHANWADGLLERHKNFTADNTRKILEEEIGEVFLHVLEDAGVYKRNEAGRSAFMRFITVLRQHRTKTVEKFT